ncbi:phosphoethanolamine transferase [Helicobacter cynogastricus]|uniref:phosphoethanolamine transferase n=1 Tax=Helicobacter cynogastricus TaxID=329937 RepID=UPI000CF18A71|nr:phosphoethanolamine transferase [Helicobacter cynogastricus]
MVLDMRFFLMWLAPVLVVFFNINAQTQYGHFYAGKVAFYSFFLTFLIYWGLSFIKQRTVLQALKNIVLTITLTFAFSEFFASYYFNMALTESLVNTILSSHWTEIRDFFTSQFIPHILLFLIVIAVCVGLASLRFQVVLKSRGVKTIFAVLLLVHALHAYKGYYSSDKDMRLFYRFLSTQVIPSVKEITLVAFNAKEHGQIQAIYDQLKRPLAKDYVHVDPDTPPNVVLIVGESASRSFMGVYGYGVPNTPFFSQLINGGGGGHFFLFNNVIAPFAYTLPVFQVLLNYSNVENSKTPWYLTESIGKILKVAGYTTFWLDNQESSYHTNAFSLLAHSFDHVYWTNSNYEYQDQVLIDTYKSKIESNLGAKNFILFHLIGNHWIYKDHFTPDFAKFTPKGLHYKGLQVQNMEDRQIVADYVNSIYYTDHILKEIFDFFKDKNALILYLSDHGQDMFRSGHTYAHKCSNYAVEIPFIVYVTDKFKQKYPDKVKAIAQAADKPFMTDDLLHSLLPLMGIHTKDNIEFKNLFSTSFDMKRKRVFCKSHVYEP